MPLVDTTTILGGYVAPQQIVDWVLGDDRQFSGDVQSSANPPPSGDLNLSDAYFTLKLNPTDTDANALIQKHITQTGTVTGIINNGLGGAKTNLLIKVFSGDYQNVTGIAAGPVYHWDFRCITQAGGVTFTVASGFVRFIQNTSQVDKAGTPATFPNSGNPQFRGFRYQSPQLDSSYTTFSNVGDIVFNQVPPANGSGPVGWQCVGQGVPGIWVAFGTFTTTGFVIPFPNSWTFGFSPPVSGTHFLGDVVWNLSPTSGLGVAPNIGWVCTGAGTPGIWKEFGPIGI